MYKSNDVAAFLQNCRNNRLEKNVDDAFQLLWNDYLSGVKVPKQQIPPSYVRKFGHKHNLYLLDLVEGWRMTYLLSSCTVHPQGVRVDIVEVLSHPEYEKRFGY